MQQHRQLERALLIGRIEPFDGLSLESRFIIAGATVKRSYEAGATIIRADETPEEVLIPTGGTVLRGDETVAAAFDVAAVLLSQPAREPYRAGDGGCTLLALTRSHMYTLLRECPRIIKNFLDTEGQRR